MRRPELNGLRIQIRNINGNGRGVYFVDQGQARLIVNPTVYNAMFRDWDNIWDLEFKQKDMIDIGKNIDHGIPICRWGPDYYFSDGGDSQTSDSRHIADPQTMNYCHFQGDVPTPSMDPKLDPRRPGVPVQWVPKHNGNRVKTWSGAPVYLIDRGQKRHILDPDTLRQLFGPDERAWGTDTLDDVPNGPDISSSTTFLVKASDLQNPPTYLMDNGRKRLIKDANTMAYYGFSRGVVKGMSWFYLSEIPDGPSIAWPPENIA